MVFYSVLSSTIWWATLATSATYVVSSAGSFVLSKGFNFVWYRILGNLTDEQKNVKAIKYEVESSNKQLIEELKQQFEEEREKMRADMHNEIEYQLINYRNSLESSFNSKERVNSETKKEVQLQPLIMTQTVTSSSLIDSRTEREKISDANREQLFDIQTTPSIL